MCVYFFLAGQLWKRPHRLAPAIWRLSYILQNTYVCTQIVPMSNISCLYCFWQQLFWFSSNSLVSYYNQMFQVDQINIVHYSFYLILQSMIIAIEQYFICYNYAPDRTHSLPFSTTTTHSQALAVHHDLYSPLPPICHTMGLSMLPINGCRPFTLIPRMSALKILPKNGMQRTYD